MEATEIEAVGGHIGKNQKWQIANEIHDREIPRWRPNIAQCCNRPKRSFSPLHANTLLVMAKRTTLLRGNNIVMGEGA